MKTRLLTSVCISLLLTVFSLGHAWSQDLGSDFVSISGTVKDTNTGRPVAFASVFIPGTHVGTVANLDGNFTLKVANSLNATKIGVSHMGYKAASFDISPRAGRISDFLIEPHSIMLQEVLVRPQDPRELVLRALQKKEENYANEPFMLTGFYRETISQRRDYISIAEAVINIYQSPISTGQHQDRVRIVQGRKSADVKDADTLILKLQGGPNMSTVLDVVRNSEVLVDEETIDFYNYEFLDIVKIGDETTYVIGFEPRVVVPYSLFEGKLYISAENLAVTMAEFSLDLSDRDKATKSFVQRKPSRLRFTPTNTRYLVTYEKIDGVYHLNYVRSELEFFADWRRRLFRTRYNVMLEMAVTHRDSENVTRFPAREAFRPRSILADMVSVYFEEDFWGDYNYIEPDESIESAIRKLNRNHRSELE